MLEATTHVSDWGKPNRESESYHRRPATGGRKSENRLMNNAGSEPASSDAYALKTTLSPSSPWVAIAEPPIGCQYAPSTIRFRVTAMEKAPIRGLFRILVTLSMMALVSGCGDEADSGTAPTIADLTYSPASGAVGVQINISGQFYFEDVDADVSGMGLEVELPDGSTQSVPAQAPQGTRGVNAGNIMFVFALQAPSAGTYGFDIWLTDDGGNASNRLSGAIEVQ